MISSSGYSDGRFSTGQYNMTEYNVDFLVTAQKDNIADSKFSGSLSVGGNKMNRKYNTFVATAEGLNIPELYTIQNGVSQKHPLIIHRRKFNPCMHWDSCLGIIICSSM